MIIMCVLSWAKGGVFMCSSTCVWKYLLDNPIELNQMGDAKR